ncbi:MAG: arylsulfatase [Planctomycetota bacterium]|nr:arylsulfatase [Planctomycetota bacterium]
MNRRTFLQRVGLASLALPAWAKAAATPDRKPNIVYIIADDLGYGDLGCYGQTHFKTPHIDRLAAEGLKFTQHYAGSTVCAPSRCVLMTGLHTGHSYVRGNKEHNPVGQEPIPAGTVTVAKRLKEAGYATGAFGKWGLGYPGSDGDPVRQGFDEFFGYNCQRNAHRYYPDHLYHNEKRVDLDGKTYSHTLIMARALDFIRRNKDRPFFCFMPVTIPHAAMQAPEKYVAPFRKQFSQFADTVGKYAGTQTKNPVAAFAGMVTALDEGVGQVLDLLAELGLDEQTIVTFTSDNGPHHEGGHKPKFFDSNGPLKGFKRDLTEGGIRVPMLARWPGRIRPGTTTDHISGFQDVLPTLCDLAGTAAPDGIDGLSLVPTLLGQPDRQKQHAYLYWEFYPYGGKRAARKGRWKAIQHGLQKKPPGPIRLFDLADDLGETRDVAGDHPEVVAEMKRIFAEAHTPSKIWTFRGL